MATNQTTPYNPCANGQVKRYNGVVWKSVLLALKSKNLPMQTWQNVLPDALHSICSLLCTSVNETPHERFFFSFFWRSTVGTLIPTWLTKPEPTQLKNHVHNSKTDPMVRKVDQFSLHSHTFSWWKRNNCFRQTSCTIWCQTLKQIQW